MIDYAKPERLEDWYRHPVSGDASFDNFQRHPSNPVHVGKEPFLWPVNGTLFNDPKSGDIYLYISCYFEGYWPSTPRAQTLHVIGYRKARGTDKWESIGTVVEGYPTKEGRGPAADLHLAYDPDSDIYYGVVGFSDQLNQCGGIASVWARSPSGPFELTEKPIICDEDMPIYGGLYQRVYACSLIKRVNDWLIVGMCSTPRNAGGTWAFCYMTSPYPDRDFSKPVMLFCPQDKLFCPPIMEFFPAFLGEDGLLYCAFTSVAANRSFQILWRVHPERAEDRDAWELFAYGSLWHNTLIPSEREGIFGQALAGLMLGSRLTVMYPALSATGAGTVNIASADFDELRNSPVMRLSGGRAPAMTFVRRSFGRFLLRCALRSEKEVVLFFGFDSVMEYTGINANAEIIPGILDETDRLILKDGKVVYRSRDKTEREIGCVAPSKDGSYRFALENRDDGIFLEGERLSDTPSRNGMIGLWVGPYSLCEVSLFAIDGDAAPCRLKLGPTEGLIGAGMGYIAPGKTNDEWLTAKEGGVRAKAAGSILKYNYHGRGARVYYRKGGRFSVYLDGALAMEVFAFEDGCIYVSASALGYHAVFIEALEAGAHIDFVEIEADA